MFYSLDLRVLNIWCLFIHLGNVLNDLKLNFEERTKVYASCGATLNGQHWIIGGGNDKRQVRHLQQKTIKLYFYYLDKSH